jgi:formylglycine-generating enzyme required for sulfatase activity
VRARRLGAIALIGALLTASCQIVAGIDGRSLARTSDAGGDDASSEGDGGDGGDGGGASAGGPFASCAAGGDGQTTCGVTHSESCCSAPVVPGGTYDRASDGATPATVSAFALGRFEVTVGRFRAFAEAVSAGYRPVAGSGKHAHVRGGAGLVGTTSASPPPEAGWDPAWTASLPTSAAAWSAALTCANSPTWDGVAASLPVVCESWFEAYAFCIWDGGFLPSEAEWGFAAAGGPEQRKYPWSAPPAATNIACTVADYDACGGKVQTVGATPPGDAKWHHADLAGNVWEWTLDGAAEYVTPCVDCANLAALPQRSHRGASYKNTSTGLYAASRATSAPDQRSQDGGFRCAYAPQP